eukprot:TRINITY_DN780003_c0_g1_i1.p1 TRINITY_DN780003_c0_g1~~TRINITY_DN780003_c0_g1_i1.p1  ORF type:complete len:350 (+),score=85.83 TRINITY_DN780003_c0_g1_i1:216-1265(+)
MGKHDFHAHSTCSDGRLSVLELVKLCKEKNVRSFTLSDHDTVNGWQEIIKAGQKDNVHVIPGIEVSSVSKENEHVHVIGLFPQFLAFTPEFKTIVSELEWRRDSRMARAQMMVEKLAKHEMPIDFERVLHYAGDAAPARPHIARAMVEAGYVTDIREAFDKFIGNEGPCYAEAATLLPLEAVEFIQKFGGLALFAHPWYCKEPELVRDSMKDIVDGIELHSCTSDEFDKSRFEKLAEGYVRLGGSDFHEHDDSPRHAAVGDITVPSHDLAHFVVAAYKRWTRCLNDVVSKIHTNENPYLLDSSLTNEQILNDELSRLIIALELTCEDFTKLNEDILNEEDKKFFENLLC